MLGTASLYLYVMMILINKINILIFSALLLFQSNEKQEGFENYLIKFKNVDLPYSITRLDLEEVSPQRTKALDSIDIVDYIEPNKRFGGGISLINVYRFYPHARLNIYDNMHVVIVLKSGGAGGVENIFSFIVYDRSGKRIDKIDFAKEVGDCSRLNLLTGEINVNLELTIEDVLLSGDCESEEYEKVNSKITRLRITREGKIIEL